MPKIYKNQEKAKQKRRDNYSPEKNKINCSKYYAKNTEEILLKNREYYQENKENILLQKKEYSASENGKETKKKYSELPKSRFSIYKRAAIKKNLEFALSLEEFIKLTSQQCYYCNDFTRDKDYVGIDRIDSNLGYISSNCVSCCRDCNLAKNKLSQEQFTDLVKRIYQNLKLGEK